MKAGALCGTAPCLLFVCLVLRGVRGWGVHAFAWIALVCQYAVKLHHCI